MLTFLGCGNRMRRDDGVGVVVVQRLAAHFAQTPVPHVQAFDCGTSGFEAMARTRGSHALCVIDACHGGAQVGTIHELTAADAIPNAPPSANLHALRWDQALAVSRALDRDAFPSDVRVWLVEAADLALGEGLSPAVASAADSLYERALKLATGYAARMQAGAP